MEQQVEYSFDQVTLRKIGKSLWIAVIAPMIVFGLTQLGSIHFHSSDPLIDYLLIYSIPVIINGAIEFIKGKSQSTLDEKIDSQTPTEG